MTALVAATSRAVRDARGLSLRAAADEIGVSASTLSRIENELAPELGLDVFKRIVEWSGESASKLMGLATDAPERSTLELISLAIANDPYLTAEQGAQLFDIIEGLYAVLASNRHNDGEAS